MKKCDKCDKPATVHVTDIVAGKMIEKDLCEDCAAAEGFTMKSEVPISQLLEDFILKTTSSESEQDLCCDVCGLSWKEFRKQAQLGCPHDYDAFAAQLEAILQRTHEGATEHVGKVPQRAEIGRAHV